VSRQANTCSDTYQKVKLSMKRVQTLRQTTLVSRHLQGKYFYVRKRVRTSCRTWTYWKLCHLGCPDILENRTLLPIVSSWLSGHIGEYDLIANRVRTRLLTVRSLCRKSRNLRTNNYTEYFPNHSSFLFLINILQ
jgi:hypothetical protein